MNDSKYAFVRTEDAPLLPPPPGQTGIIGWLWRNMFSSMSNFSTPSAALQSIMMMLLTLGVGWFGVSQIYGLLDFAIFSAVWNSPEGVVKRDACTTTLQGGKLPADWFGACYPYVSAFWQSFIYGDYPTDELWRVNTVFLLGALGIGWLVSDSIPRRRVTGLVLIAAGVGYGLLVWDLYQEPLGMRVGVQMLIGLGALFLIAPANPPRRWVGMLMLAVYPVLAFVLLTGGDLEAGQGFWWSWGVVGVVLLGFGFGGARGALGDVGSALAGAGLALAVMIAAIMIAVFASTIDLGLETVTTEIWGGLLVTLVVAIAGIVFSLPLGILLALGRRSSLPAIRLLSIIFIEFWRGVPLITVLFMSSVMLPFFLPPGVEFNKLLRALIGVMFFAAAYQAEVVRGGLQAIPKGQFEGAQAVGLSYWKMMRLIVLPQALTLVIPGIVNTFIGLFKDTTLVLIISLFDLLGKVQQTFNVAEWSTPVQASTGYLMAAVIFWLFCFGMSRYSLYMERQLRRGHAR